MENAPDLIIGFNEGFRMDWNSPIGKLSNEVIFDNDREWKADHLIDPKFVPGVLFSSVKLITSI